MEIPRLMCKRNKETDPDKETRKKEKKRLLDAISGRLLLVMREERKR
jgi:hypothetical protein